MYTVSVAADYHSHRGAGRDEGVKEERRRVAECVQNVEYGREWEQPYCSGLLVVHTLCHLLVVKQTK